MECPKEIFDKLWAARGSGTNDESYVSFAHKALAVSAFTGLIRLSFDQVKATHIESWDSTEDWITDQGMDLSLEDVFSKYDDDLWSEAIMPCHFVKDGNGLIALAVDALRTKADAGELELTGIACTEIKNGDRTLLLIYEDGDAWGLGHGNYIEVIEDLSELTEAAGYYAL